VTIHAAGAALGLERGPGPVRQGGAGAQAGPGARGLDAAERREVAELERTDREVRAHEGAHLAAAGGLARGVSFEFVTGPDGRQYAVAGEVSIDSSPVSGDPEKTIQKAQQIRAAATAPAQPSGQDQQVAAQAAQLEQAARQELAERHRKEQTEALEGSGAAQTHEAGTTLEAFA
jgi:hypothetical protein